MKLTDEQILAIDETVVKMEEHVETVLGEQFLEQWLGITRIANGIQMIEEDLTPQDVIACGLDILNYYL